MFSAIGRFFREYFGNSRPIRWDGDPPPVANTEAAKSDSPPGHDAQEVARDVVPFDETLLERCRLLWQAGDWEGIKVFDRETLQHHPDRAKLALLVAAAHQQTGSMDDARNWVRLAREWGCSKQLISQIMISGVFNTLARASAVAGQMDRARLHFEAAMRCGALKGDVAKLTRARIATQLSHMESTSGVQLTSGGDAPR